MDFGKGLTEKFQQNHLFFIQSFPQYRDSDTTPDDGKHQDVDTGFTVFPCRAVEGETDVLPTENREDEAGYRVEGWQQETGEGFASGC